MSKRFASAAVCLVASVFYGSALRAQDYRATITGVVTDSSGAVLPNATVKAVNAESNETTQAKSNAQGFYTLPFLNPGQYSVSASAAGFATLQKDKIVLRVADQLNLPITLSPGQQSQTVTVDASAELLQTSNANRGLNFDPLKTQEYPLNGRQVYMLLSLTPGVIFTQQQFGAKVLLNNNMYKSAFAAY